MYLCMHQYMYSIEFTRLRIHMCSFLSKQFLVSPQPAPLVSSEPLAVREHMLRFPFVTPEYSVIELTVTGSNIISSPSILMYNVIWFFTHIF